MPTTNNLRQLLGYIKSDFNKVFHFEMCCGRWRSKTLKHLYNNYDNCCFE